MRSLVLFSCLLVPMSGGVACAYIEGSAAWGHWEVAGEIPQDAFAGATVWLRSAQIDRYRGVFGQPRVLLSRPAHRTRELAEAALIDRLAVRSVSTGVEARGSADIIVDIRMSGRYTTPWWTWIQLLDLLIHTLVFPTMGSNLEWTGTLEAAARDGSWQVRWSFTHEQLFFSQGFGMMWLRESPPDGDDELVLWRVLTRIAREHGGGSS